MQKKNQGVTLIALAVTIIVMLILAGATMSVLTGDSGMITQARKAKINSEIAEAEELANSAYSELKMEDTDVEVTIANIVNYLEGKGYTINQTDVNENSIQSIEIDQASQNSITIGAGESKEITLKTIYSTTGNYYIELNKKNYKLNNNDGKIKIDKEATNLNGNKKFEVKSNSNNLKATINDKTITLKSAGSSNENTKITITYGEYKKEISVSVVKKPEHKTENYNLTFSTEYGVVDIIWIDTNNNVKKTPNDPITENGGEEMTPIKWVEDKEETTTKSDASWYNYNSKMWANAKTQNGSYFVWIPRFAYRIIYYSDSNCSTMSGAWDGLGLWSVDGQSRGTKDDGIESITYNGEEYIVHPAFGTNNRDGIDKNIDLGGWGTSLSGFWVAKFEVSQNAKGALQSIPGVKSVRNQKIGQQYNTGRKATYGYNGQKDLSDNNTSYMSSHMMKNSEWGAVAYLAHSKYGRYGKAISANPSNDYTGGGEGETYIANGAQSTTGNAYGIYDLVGGANESVAMFNSKEGTEGDFGVNSGWSTEANFKRNSNSTKYVTRYKNPEEGWIGTRLFEIYQYTKMGDAMKEVSVMTAYGKAWFNNKMQTAIESSDMFCFLCRGGQTGDDIGIFYSSYQNGFSSSNVSFRTVLCP